MKIIFMGTPDFSVGTLEALIEAGHEVCLVVTQPDKPKGRGKEMQPTPVKAAAEELGIPVFQPVKIREAKEVLEQTEADVYEEENRKSAYRYGTGCHHTGRMWIQQF